MMKQYSSYKDSGIEWIGEIPSHWEVKRVGSVFSQRNEVVSDTDYQPLSVTKNGIVPQMEGVAKTDNNDNRKLVLNGDYVINSRSDRKGSSGLSYLDGSVSVINIVLYPFGIYPKITPYMFKSYDFIEEYFRNGKGIVWDLWSTRFNEMKNILLPLPPLTEQEQIVSYLDDKTTKIDELIHKKLRKIDLLKEYRTSLINTVVTKGLNSNVPMKESGIEWIGEIPEHWNVGKLKHICRENVKSLSNNTNPDYELDYIEISDVNSDGLIKNSTHYTFSESPSRCRRIVNKGDVILSTVRTYLRSIGLIENEVRDLICSTGFSVLTPNSGIHSKHLFYMVRTEWFISMVISKSEGVSYPSIQSEKLMNNLILVIPEDEQIEIIKHLDSKTKEIDNLVQLEQTKIDILKQYRQSLISEVVTGKIKVTN
jgi:type I restriction enzyme S subunit